jgi:hypothetical protein
MSFTEYKTVVRAKIKELNGADTRTALDFFKERIGEPEEIDEFDGEIEWFRYKDDAGCFTPVSRNKEWGIDFVIAHSNAYNGDPQDVNLSLEEIEEYMKRLVLRIGVNLSDCRLVIYSWYNGVDEPIHFQ